MRAGTEVDGRQAALADRLHRLRSDAGLGVLELAAEAGLDPGRYRDAESGDPGGLTYLDVLALADALRVPVSVVLAD